MKKLKFFGGLLAFFPVHFWNHLRTTKSAADRRGIAVHSLQIAQKATFIAGLVTSFFFVGPTVYQYSAAAFPGWVCLIFAVFGCLVSATMVDLPMSALLPAAFDRVSDISNKKTLLEVVLSFVFAGCLGFMTMFFSYKGTTQTTAWMMEDKKPKTTNVVAIDSAKNAAAANIRKEHATIIKTAKDKDAANIAEAANITAGVYARAADRFPYYKTNDWHKKEYNKMVDKAKKDSTIHRQQYTPKLDATMVALNSELHTSAAAYQYKIDMAKKTDFNSADEYASALNVVRLFFRDLGTYATAVFGFITFLLWLMFSDNNTNRGGVSRKKKLIKQLKTGNTPTPVAADAKIKLLRQHLPQDTLRINETIKWNLDHPEDTPRECATTLAGYIQKWEEIKYLDPVEYDRLSNHYKDFYTKKYKNLYGSINFPMVYNDESARAAFYN